MSPNCTTLFLNIAHELFPPYLDWRFIVSSQPTSPTVRADHFQDSSPLPFGRYEERRIDGVISWVRSEDWTDVVDWMFPHQYLRPNEGSVHRLFSTSVLFIPQGISTPKYGGSSGRSVRCGVSDGMSSVPNPFCRRSRGDFGAGCICHHYQY